MDRFATRLHASLLRAKDAVIDEIAKDGVGVLKGVIDSAGFGKSEYLKDYEVYAHVDGDEIMFEIVLDFSAIEAQDKQAQEVIENARPAVVSQSARTYGVGSNGVQRMAVMKDARKGSAYRAGRVRDARTPAKDARRTAGIRLLGHEISAHMPRSAYMTKAGRLSVGFRRSLKASASGGLVYPVGKLQGLIKDFVDELTGVVAEKFSPELEKILTRRLP